MTSKKKAVLIGWLICALGAIFYCYEYLLRIEPSIMVPNLMAAFSVTAVGIGSLIGLYYYAYTPMQLIVGVLIDRYGTRLMISLAVIACTIGSLLFGLPHSLLLVSVGRFLIGLGSSFAFIGVLKLAAEWLPKHHFALFTGITTALGMIGAMIGVVGLTHIKDNIGWQPTLYIGTIVGVILMPIIWLFVRDTPKWRTVQVGAKTSFSATFKGLWRIIKNPQMWLAGLVGCMFYLSLSLFGELWGIPFIQKVYNVSPDSAALACSMLFAGWLVGAPVNGWLSDAIKTRKLLLIIGGLLSLIVSSIIIFKPFVIATWVLFVLLFLFGIFSSVQIICFAISRENNHTKIAATSVAFTNLVIMLGGMIFQPLIGLLLDLNWDGTVQNGIRVYSGTSYQLALWVLPICILIGVILALVLRETYGKVAVDEFE
jgi:MFS family permease